MKILMVSLGFYPAVAWGGPIKVVYEDSIELLRRGHQVVVCASNLLDKRQRLAPGLSVGAIDGIRVVYLNAWTLPGWPGTLGPTLLSLASLRFLWDEIRQADIVHAHGTRNAMVVASAVICIFQRKPFLLQPHGTLPRILNSIWAKRIFDGLFLGPLLGAARRIIALQESEKQQILLAGGRSDRTRTVPNGIALSEIGIASGRETLRAKHCIAPQTKLILYLGRLNRKKGVDLLVKAYARVRELLPGESRLLIAGPDDGQLAEIKALIASHGLQEFVLLSGALRGREVQEAYAAADLFVLPCRVDTFPMTILEACRAGLPLVITETCEIAPLISGVAGEVVPVDVEALARGMSRVLADDRLREKYQRGTGELARTAFSIQNAIGQLEQVYNDVLQDER